MMGRGLRTGKVGDVAEEPNEEESHREAVCALGFVIGDKLRKLFRMLGLAGAIGIGESRLTSKHIQATRLMQPNMPDKDSPTSGEVVAAAAILTVIVAMAVGMRVAPRERDGGVCSSISPGLVDGREIAFIGVQAAPP